MCAAITSRRSRRSRATRACSTTRCERAASRSPSFRPATRCPSRSASAIPGNPARARAGPACLRARGEPMSDTSISSTMPTVSAPTATTATGSGLAGTTNEFLKLFMARLQQRDPFQPHERLRHGRAARTAIRRRAGAADQHRAQRHRGLAVVGRERRAVEPDRPDLQRDRRQLRDRYGRHVSPPPVVHVDRRPRAPRS